MSAQRMHQLMLAVLGCSLCTLAATAQTLTVTGSCPGPMTFDVTGALPDSQLGFLTADGPGTEVVPTGTCEGTELGLAGDLVPRLVLTSDGSGQASLSADLPQEVCGSWAQVLDLGDCGTSNAEVINFAEPTSIDVSCDATQNPLRFSCTVTVDPPQPVDVRYSRTDGLGVERANRGDEVVASQQVPVLFLAPEKAYAIEAVAAGHPQGPMATDTLMTGAPPFDVDSWLTFVGESTMGLVGAENPCDGDATAVVYDTTTGDLVWYHDIDPNGSLGVLNMVSFTAEQTVVGETGNGVVEVDLLGGVLTDFNVDYPGCCNLHHDIYKANGNYYGFYQDTRAGLTLDPVVVLDAQGNELFEWNPHDVLPVPPGSFGDWLHTNSVWVDEDGTAVLSWLTRDSVAKVDLNPQSPTFGEVLWIMDGNPPDALPPDITIDWSNVGGANFFSQQHNFHRRHDGRYMLLDNDHGRGIVFTIDEVNRTATADAVYPTAEFFCGAQGTADDTEDGNALVACGNDALREYDGVTDALIWDAEVDCANGGGFGGPGVARWNVLDGWSKAFLPNP